MNRGKRLVHESDDEDEPIQIDDESSVVNDDTVSLCLLGKLWTEKQYSTFALIETMKKIWNPSKGVTCRELGSNLISFQFAMKRDMDRVLALEPWFFNKHLLVLRPLALNIQPSLMTFDTTPCWIRIYDLPILGRESKVINQIGSRFGEVLEVDESTMMGLARSVRLKILLNLNKPMKRGTKIRIGSAEPCWLPATYERISSFCYWCGKLGHTYKDCDDFYERADNEIVVLEKNMPYGEWMKASPMKHVQISPTIEAEDKERARKSLFQKRVTKSGERKDVAQVIKHHTKVEDEVEEVSKLLKSMEKVAVGDIRRVNNIDKGKAACDSRPYTTESHMEGKLEKKQLQGNASTDVNDPVTYQKAPITENPIRSTPTSKPTQKTENTTTMISQNPLITLQKTTPINQSKVTQAKTPSPPENLAKTKKPLPQKKPETYLPILGQPNNPSTGTNLPYTPLSVLIDMLKPKETPPANLNPSKDQSGTYFTREKI